MPTVALYARYSSDHQRDASIEDQLRICRERAHREGWQIIDSYSDRSISGASLIRPGIQALMADAQAGRFDIVLAESLDRISRDQEDIAGVYKRLSFAGVRMVTISEGEVNELHIGLKGTMGALYLPPDTGKRVSRLNPKSEWIIQEGPELRIIDDDLWRAPAPTMPISHRHGRVAFRSGIHR